MARDKILTLTPEQHKLLGHALALAHAVHSQMGGNGLGVAPGELPAIYDDVDIFVQPGAHGGRGFFSTLGDAVSRNVHSHTNRVTESIVTTTYRYCFDAAAPAGRAHEPMSSTSLCMYA